MKLWLDDIREPAAHGAIGFVWAKTYEEAIAYLSTGQVTFASLDHPRRQAAYAVTTWEELLAKAEADRRRRPPSPPTPPMQRLLFVYPERRIREEGMVRDWARLRRALRRSGHRLGPWERTTPFDAMVLSYHGGWAWNRTVYQQTHRGPREVGTLYGAPDRRIPPEGR